MAGFFADLLSDLDIEDPTYVEPYAGGAGAGVALLSKGIINHLVINDIDNAVYAFWHTVKHHTAWLISQVETVPLTIEEWLRQREIYQEEDVTDLRALGLSFFYLNRTNRSGILNAGVIGGQKQAGKYKIDARFNRETLSERIFSLGTLADRITLHNLDGREVIQMYGSDPNALIYIDPPYVGAGNSLYLNAFDARDHEALGRNVHKVSEAHWVVTYDDHSLVRSIFEDDFIAELEITYSANKPGRAIELLIVSPKIARVLKKKSKLLVHKKNDNGIHNAPSFV